MAVDGCAAFGAAVFGNTDILPDIRPLPLIRDSNTDQAAFGRFARPVSSTCYDKQKLNRRQLLPYPNSIADYGVFYVSGGSATRADVHLLLRHYIGLLRFSF